MQTNDGIAVIINGERRYVVDVSPARELMRCVLTFDNGETETVSKVEFGRLLSVGKRTAEELNILQ